MIHRRNSQPSVVARCCAQALEPRTLLAAGQLDPSFGDGGLLRSFFPATEQANAIALGPGGTIVIAGHDGYGIADFVIIRLKRDGSPDTSFGFGGQMITDFSTGGSISEDIPTAVAVQANGKILVGGTGVFGNYDPLQRRTVYSRDMVVVRYNVDGTLDPTFGTEGVAHVDFGDDETSAGMVLQPDGKVVLAGSSLGDIVLARLTAGGALDSSFDTDGKLRTNLGRADAACSVGLQRSGHIVVVATTQAAPTYNTQAALIRYTSSGALAGQTLFRFGEFGTIPLSMAIGPQDQIMLAGNDGQHAQLARFGASGSLDDSWGGDGLVTTADLDDPRAIALGSDGKVLLAGGRNGDYFIARYRSGGTLDSTFSGNGIATIDWGVDSGARAMAVQPDGRLLVTGDGFRTARLLGDSTMRISGSVYRDRNSNGRRDSNEPPLASVRVWLDENGNGRRDAQEPTTLSNSLGVYQFTEVPFGTYTVRVAPATGLRLTTVGAYRVTGTTTDCDFGLSSSALVGGMVFNDANGNGVRNTGELGLAGWVVYADLNANGRRDSGEVGAITDSAGRYRLTLSGSRTYVLRLAVKSGWTLTRPASGFFTLALSPAQLKSGKHFGVQR